MAEQDSVGNQLLRQRPDLVRRAWVPILVRIDVDINVMMVIVVMISWVSILVRMNDISDGNCCPGQGWTLFWLDFS